MLFFTNFCFINISLSNFYLNCIIKLSYQNSVTLQYLGDLKTEEKSAIVSWFFKQDEIPKTKLPLSLLKNEVEKKNFCVRKLQRNC